MSAVLHVVFVVKCLFHGCHLSVESVTCYMFHVVYTVTCLVHGCHEFVPCYMSQVCCMSQLLLSVLPKCCQPLSPFSLHHSHNWKLSLYSTTPSLPVQSKVVKRVFGPSFSLYIDFKQQSTIVLKVSIVLLTGVSRTQLC